MAKGGFVQELPIIGSQGRIVVKNGRAIITLNSKIQNPKRKRFILAHEFGHFMLHTNSVPAFNCNVEDFVDWQGTRREEAEANRFAANLLMPPTIFKSACDGMGFNLSNIDALSDRFQSSFMSTAIRFVELGSYPCAVVYSKDKIVKWAAFSSDFPTNELPLQYIEFGSTIPVGSVSHDVYSTGQVPTGPSEVDPSAWFSDCYNLRHYMRWKFYEECRYYKPFNSVLSFIYTR